MLHIVQSVTYFAGYSNTQSWNSWISYECITLQVISVHGCWMYNLGIVITQLHITRNKRNFGEHIVHSYIYVSLKRIMTSIIYVIVWNLANKLKVFNAFKETLRYGTPVVGSSYNDLIDPGTRSTNCYKPESWVRQMHIHISFFVNCFSCVSMSWFLYKCMKLIVYSWFYSSSPTRWWLFDSKIWRARNFLFTISRS